ncbi:MAG: MOSC domain-containing protein [Flavobacteriaceae bacterium]|nr:MOSC domain-containing protein [Flavobacteriaceae bacterium]
MKIISVNIGERRKVQWRNKVVETGIFKYPSDSPIFLDKEDVLNDAVVDRKHHGGIEKAVYGYSENYYEFWKQLYPHLDWNYGMFGENLTIADLDETNTFVGNVYNVGEAKIEVTKPREPCYKLGIRFNDPKIIKQFWNSTKSGIYFKVLQPGFINKDDKMILIKEASDNPTIAQIYQSLK